MQNREEVLGWARELIDIESRAIQRLKEQLNDDFFEVVSQILNSEGRVVVSGIGKSAAIANKIVATLNSTGTPSLFMHAADAVHGDLGMIQKGDTVICISKSGNTPEIKALVPLLLNGGNKLVAMVGSMDSFLAKHAHYCLNVYVEKEACPNNLAPTTSTTAQLVMGDALAVALLKSKGFTSKDFAKYHPGGALGKRLYTTLGDLANLNGKPNVGPEDSVHEVIVELTQKRLGAVAVIDNQTVVGIITDGDIRRMLEKVKSIEGLVARDIMGNNPVMMEGTLLASQGAIEMTKRKITQLIVTMNGSYQGMVHLHDLNREGII